jgi:hypothetical protein
MAPYTGTLANDYTKLTFQSAIDEDSGEATSSNSTNPKEVARVIESKLKMPHAEAVNSILFDRNSSLRAIFREGLYENEMGEHLKKLYNHRQTTKRLRLICPFQENNTSPKP